MLITMHSTLMSLLIKNTIVKYKHSQSLQHEVKAANALFSKNNSSKAILHFDTTK